MLLVHRRSERALVDWALSLGLALYVGGLMQFYMPLRTFAGGCPGFWVMALLVLSWVCDSSAYFVGGAFGRTPLAPGISPKKSVEGAIAGLVAPALVGPLLGLAVGVPPLLMAGYGLTIAIATIVGDLVESFVKRQTGVKDSGVLIPGHGGLLDRMDSLLFCAPARGPVLARFRGMKRVAVLGSTGSIGRQTLDVVRWHPDEFSVVRPRRRPPIRAVQRAAGRVPSRDWRA